MYVTPYFPGALSSGPGPGSDTMMWVWAGGFAKLSFCDCHSLNAANCAACLAVLALTVISAPLIGLKVNSISFSGYCVDVCYLAIGKSHGRYCSQTQREQQQTTEAPYLPGRRHSLWDLLIVKQPLSVMQYK